MDIERMEDMLEYVRFIITIIHLKCSFTLDNVVISFGGTVKTAWPIHGI